MKKPRKINWCEVTAKMAENPKTNISQFLPDKKMTTMLEWLLMEQHIKADKCPTCNANLDIIEQKTPPKKPEDRIKNEN